MLGKIRDETGHLNHQGGTLDSGAGSPQLSTGYSCRLDGVSGFVRNGHKGRSETPYASDASKEQPGNYEDPEG